MMLPRLPSFNGVEVRHIPGSYGYCATSDGRVFTCLRGGAYKKLSKWRRLRGCAHINKSAVQITVNTRRTYLHRIILETFVGPCPKGMEGCHNDGDPFNNCISNLRWDTRRSNVDDTIKHDRMCRGERSGQSKLTDSKVFKIREAYASGETQQSIARRFNISRPTISVVVNGKTWAHLPIVHNAHKKTHKLSIDQRLEIVKLRISGSSNKSIASRFGIHRSYIRKLVATYSNNAL